MFRLNFRIAMVCTAVAGFVFALPALAQESCVMGTNDEPDSARRSVVITSKDKVDLSAFALDKVLNKIIETSDRDNVTGIKTSSEERDALLQSLLRSMRRKSFRNAEAKVEVSVQRRPEAELTPAELQDKEVSNGLPKGMHPVALFNRLDLAPVDFQNCGEHRIVYMLGSGVPDTRRMTLIFEARVKNPAPEKGQLGCLPIAQFWKGLEQKKPEDIASALDAFYFAGDLNGDGVKDLDTPVVHFENYGFDRGQIRGNLFVTHGAVKFKWQLREWQTDLNPDGSPYFRVETVKDTPVFELWTDLPADSPLASQKEFLTLQKEFHREILTANLQRLLQPEGAPAGADEVQFISLVGAEFSNTFNDFESVSQGQEDNPEGKVSASLREGLEARLKAVTFESKPSVDEVINRAGTVTCGGCHEFSNSKQIGKKANGEPLRWPTSKLPTEERGFTHTKENGDLSPALMESFLVARCRSLNKFIEKPNAFGLPAGLLSAFAEIDLSDQIATIQSAPNDAARLNSLSELKTRTLTLREVQQRLPGAFVPVRRVH